MRWLVSLVRWLVSLVRCSCSIIGLIYSQGWQLNVNKLSAFNANTFKKTYNYREFNNNTKTKTTACSTQIILLHSCQLSCFKSFPKYEKKGRVLKVFSVAEKFFSKPMLGSNRPIRDIFEFSCLLLLAEIAAKICKPIRKGKKIQKYHELADWVSPA